MSATRTGGRGMGRVQKSQAAKRKRRAAKEGTPKAMREVARSIGMQVTPSAKELRWPYGPPDKHERCCVLFEGKDYCDCKASDTAYGFAP